VQYKRKIQVGFTIFFLCFAVSFAVAQRIVPGYIGKKNIVFGGGKIHALTAYNFLMGANVVQPALCKRSLTWDVGVQRVIGRSGMMGASFSYFSNDVFSAVTDSYEPSHYSGYDLGVQFRSYYYRSKGSIAPVGKHFRYNIILHSYTLNTDDHDLLIGKTTELGLGLGRGNSRVLFDKLWIDYGWEFNVLLNVYDQQDVVRGFDYTAQARANTRSMALITFKMNFGYFY